MLTRRIFLASSLGVAAFSTSPSLLKANENPSYKITPKLSKASLLENPDIQTTVWAYDGIVPGPVIRAKKGEEITLEVFNQLDQPTTIHWHGIRIENAMDGVAELTQEPILPGESFIYKFTPPDAGTYWYHPHNKTWEQLARGLYGTLIVEGDNDEGDFDKDYPIVADDWRLQDDGLIHEASLGSMRDWSHAGRLGNILTLNGNHYEKLNVNNGERVRLRFINASNARVMKFAIANQDTNIIALDGQAITPVPLGQDGVTLAPAQRADLMVTIQGKAGDEIAILETSGTDNLIAGYLVCGQETKKHNPEQAYPGLKTNSLPEPDLTNARELELVMNGGAMRFLISAVYKGEELDGRNLAREHQQVWAFNGIAGMAEKPFFSASRGETIKIKMINETMWPHAIHLHGHHFKVLSRKAASTKIDEFDKGTFRDTALLAPEETVEIALLTDNPGKWMMHCHMLEHQASGMATWFEVV